VKCVTLLSYNVRSILSRPSRFDSPTVGTNLPFCVDVPLNNQSNQHHDVARDVVFKPLSVGIFCV